MTKAHFVTCYIVPQESDKLHAHWVLKDPHFKQKMHITKLLKFVPATVSGVHVLPNKTFVVGYCIFYYNLESRLS